MQELELQVDVESLDKLLDFLSCSFMGGTDVDQPLMLSLERLKKQEWEQVGARGGVHVGAWRYARRHGCVHGRHVWQA